MLSVGWSQVPAFQRCNATSWELLPAFGSTILSTAQGTLSSHRTAVFSCRWKVKAKTSNFKLPAEKRKLPKPDSASS